MSATETQPTPTVTIFSRVAGIPLISSLHSTLLANHYTSSPYAKVQGISTTAIQISQPITIRLAPYITRADGYANKGFDAVESRYPQINTKPEEIVDYVKGRKQSAEEYVRQTTENVDQRFTPIVDYFEVAITRVSNSTNAEAGPSKPKDVPETKYQYQRAYALSMNLKDHLYVYSTDQIKHLQNENVLVQRATDTAQNITALASSSLTTAQASVHNLTSTMINQLSQLAHSTAQLPASLQASFPELRAHLQASSTHLQQSFPELQNSFADLSAALQATVADLRKIISADAPVNEKAAMAGKEVADRVNPLLESVRQRVAEVVNTLKEKKGDVVQVKEEAKEKVENGDQ